MAPRDDNDYKHEVYMDFPAAKAAQDSIRTSIDFIESELIAADSLIHSDLRWSWYGLDAVEFFSLYDPAYKTMVRLLDHMRDMNNRFLSEIGEWEDMAVQLAGTS